MKELIPYLTKKMTSGKTIYAILDAAKQPEIAWKPYEFLSEWVSLYKGEPEEVLADVAPYLVNLSRGSEINKDLIQWIAETCWGDSCAVFLESDMDLQGLLTHFQQFLMVTDEAGKPFYFRFYDPRVLRIYLPTCNTDELTTFFGPVHSFFMEDESTENIIHFVLSGEELLSDNYSLSNA
jgi:hypothetical protein